jgi:alkanesulfonate monooxygenase SsuD/methylene tetrahydromethanopterin reductase-like flavin-dependent oxidoreductase (luciferase family)
MTNFGYTLMTEQSGPKDIVQYAVSADDRGFDFEVCSDHFSPWLTSQGPAPNAWALLGSGENVNEHVAGKGWPTIERRQDTLREAIKIIRELFDGGGGTTETVGPLFGPVTVTVCGGAWVGGTGLVFTTATSIAAANLRKAHR